MVNATHDATNCTVQFTKNRFQCSGCGVMRKSMWRDTPSEKREKRPTGFNAGTNEATDAVKDIAMASMR